MARKVGDTTTLSARQTDVVMALKRGAHLTLRGLHTHFDFLAYDNQKLATVSAKKNTVASLINLGLLTELGETKGPQGLQKEYVLTELGRSAASQIPDYRDDLAFKRLTGNTFSTE